MNGAVDENGAPLQRIASAFYTLVSAFDKCSCRPSWRTGDRLTQTGMALAHDDPWPQVLNRIDT